VIYVCVCCCYVVRCTLLVYVVFSRLFAFSIVLFCRPVLHFFFALTYVRTLRSFHSIHVRSTVALPLFPILRSTWFESRSICYVTFVASFWFPSFSLRYDFRSYRLIVGRFAFVYVPTLICTFVPVLRPTRFVLRSCSLHLNRSLRLHSFWSIAFFVCCYVGRWFSLRCSIPPLIFFFFFSHDYDRWFVSVLLTFCCFTFCGGSIPTFAFSRSRCLFRFDFTFWSRSTFLAWSPFWHVRFTYTSRSVPTFTLILRFLRPGLVLICSIPILILHCFRLIVGTFVIGCCCCDFRSLFSPLPARCSRRWWFDLTFLFAFRPVLEFSFVTTFVCSTYRSRWFIPRCFFRLVRYRSDLILIFFFFFFISFFFSFCCVFDLRWCTLHSVLLGNSVALIFVRLTVYILFLFFVWIRSSCSFTRSCRLVVLHSPFSFPLLLLRCYFFLFIPSLTSPFLPFPRSVVFTFILFVLSFVVLVVCYFASHFPVLPFRFPFCS